MTPERSASLLKISVMPRVLRMVFRSYVVVIDNLGKYKSAVLMGRKI